MGLFLGKAEAIAAKKSRGFVSISNHQHVHVVILPATGIGREVHILVHHILDGSPFREDIPADPP